MSENNSEWMDDYDPDPEVKNCLQCDIEIQDESGDTYRNILARVAEGLREIATQIETGKLDDGHHVVRWANGEKLGEVYLDYYGTGPR